MPGKKSMKKKDESITKGEVVRLINRKIRVSNPLGWIDILFTGDTVSTTPNNYSLLYNAILQASTGNGVHTGYQSWQSRIGDDGNLIYQNKLLLSGYHYQLRFATNDTISADYYNTIRLLFYRLGEGTEDIAEGKPTALLNGADVDSPPDTIDVEKMYLDKVFHIRSLAATGTSSDIATGNKIFKGFKKVRKQFEVFYDPQKSAANLKPYSEVGNILMEFQSDSSATPHPQVFGYVRVYYRLLE